MEDAPLSQPPLSPPAPPPVVEPPVPLYFPVSTTKLVVMSVCTWSVYPTYWFYQNWRLIKKRERSNLSPFWRAVFGLLFCYACFKRIDRTAESLRLPEGIAVGLLTTGLILFSLAGAAPSPYWILGHAAVVFLVPVQGLVNDINKVAAPGHHPNDRYSGWNIAGIIVGSLFWGMTLLSLWAARQAP